MNKRLPNQIKVAIRECSVLIWISVIAILMAVLLCGCGKKNGIDDIQTADAESSAPPATEMSYNSSQSVGTPSQADSYAEESEAEVSDAVFYPINFSDANNFAIDYGFSENRAWVRNDSFDYYLINPDGEIIYEVPATVMVEGHSDPISDHRKSCSVEFGWQHIGDPDVFRRRESERHHRLLRRGR